MTARAPGRAFTLHRGSWAHAPVIAELMARCFPGQDQPAKRWSAQAIAETLALPGRDAWLGCIPDPGGVPAPLGYCLGHALAGEAVILSFGVLAGHRGLGLGAALLDRALASFQAQGAKAVFLETRDGNAAAARLYQGRGFTVMGTRRGYYRAGGVSADAVLWRRTLTGPPAEPP